MEQLKGCNVHTSFICGGCQKCTLCLKEYYMLTFQIWRKVNGRASGMLCIDCVEERLGRQLTNKDFLDCNLNKGIFNLGRKVQDRILTI